MANYQQLKNSISNVIKPNYNGEITGLILQQALLAMITNLGTGFQLVGIATPTTNPGDPDPKVFYLASQPGTYTHFGNIVKNDNKLAILTYTGVWAMAEIGAAVIDTLDSEETTSALSANMGRVLHNSINQTAQDLDDIASDLNERTQNLVIAMMDKADKINYVSTILGEWLVLHPNVFFDAFNAVTDFTIELYPAEDISILNVYMVTFTCGADPAITLPDNIHWNTEPMFEEGKTYEITIRGLYGTINVWE